MAPGFKHRIENHCEQKASACGQREVLPYLNLHKLGALKIFSDAYQNDPKKACGLVNVLAIQKLFNKLNRTNAYHVI
jgi:hypothetical protein